MSDKIPDEVAEELIALKQFSLAVFATLTVDQRQGIVKNFSRVDSPRMKNLVQNMKLIPRSSPQ